LCRKFYLKLIFISLSKLKTLKIYDFSRKISSEGQSDPINMSRLQFFFSFLICFAQKAEFAEKLKKWKL
jgi:hypothetical protein